MSNINMNIGRIYKYNNNFGIIISNNQNIYLFDTSNSDNYLKINDLVIFSYENLDGINKIKRIKKLKNFNRLRGEYEKE